MKKHRPFRQTVTSRQSSRHPASAAAQHTDRRSVDLLPVRDLDAMRLHIAESLRLSGDPARRFVIAGADRLDYRLCWNVTQVIVQRLDERGRVLHSTRPQPAQFLQHSLFEAMRSGQLFTPALRQSRTSH